MYYILRVYVLHFLLHTQIPRLEEIILFLLEVLCGKTYESDLYHDSDLVHKLLDGLLAHYFSSDRPYYHSDDVRWFLQLANAQLHWQVDHLEPAAVTATAEEESVCKSQSAEVRVQSKSFSNLVIYSCIWEYYLTLITVSNTRSPHLYVQKAMN